MRFPELGTSLPKTQAFVCSELDKLGISYKVGTEDSSIVAIIDGAYPGKVVALRSDMDALPIKEDTGLPFASKHDGKMHACGHDAHMAMPGAAKILSENKRRASRNSEASVSDSRRAGYRFTYHDQRGCIA